MEAEDLQHYCQAAMSADCGRNLVAGISSLGTDSTSSPPHFACNAGIALVTTAFACASLIATYYGKDML